VAKIESKLKAGKRCGMQRCDWMSDWFVSWSPRNNNSNAEGPWHHWANLAAMILSDPRTEAVAPDLYRPDLKPNWSMYAEANELPKELIPDDGEEYDGD
jgi:hypothetical protein